MTYSIFIQTPEGQSIHVRGEELQDIRVCIHQKFGIPEDIQKFHIGGKILNDVSQLSDDCTVVLFFGLMGGKGGFGSLLKNQAQTRRKITNWDQSRDREGRRIINSKNENNLIDYYLNKQNEQKKIQEEKKQVELQQATLKAHENDIKLDQAYIKTLKQNEKIIENSMKQAIGSKLQKTQAKIQKKIDVDCLNEINQFLEENDAVDTITKKVKAQ